VLRDSLVGLGGFLILVVGWVGVQRAWRRIVAGGDPDGDGLAGKIGCFGCGCEGECERRGRGPRPARKEAS
jgi:hypothetical protein